MLGACWTCAGAAVAAAAWAGGAASSAAAIRPALFPKKCTGQRPVHSSRKLVTHSPIRLPVEERLRRGADLTAFSTAHRRHGRWRRRRSSIGRGTGIVLPVVDVAVHPAVVVAVGPDRAGEAADRSADHRALKDAHARNDRSGRGAKRRAAEGAGRGAGEDAVRGGVIARRRTGI